jgi:hypothetical protein
VVHGDGTPSASATSGFVVSMTSLEGRKTGLILYGFTGRNAAPWSATSTSYLCVRPPVFRTHAQNTAGNYGSCDGVLSLDFNTWLSQHASASAGQHVDAQAWFRDLLAPKGSNLSGGIEFTLEP